MRLFTDEFTGLYENNSQVNMIEELAVNSTKPEHNEYSNIPDDENPLVFLKKYCPAWDANRVGLLTTE